MDDTICQRSLIVINNNTYYHIADLGGSMNVFLCDILPKVRQSYGFFHDPNKVLVCSIINLCIVVPIFLLINFDVYQYNTK